MNKPYTNCFFIACLLLCSACTTVRQAPVVDRQETDTVADTAADAAGTMPADSNEAAGSGLGRAEEDAGGTWIELPRPEHTEPQGGTRETEAAVLPERLSDNSAVLALMDETDYRLGEGDAEGAAGSVERALRLEPKNPWLWHRLAVLRLRQGHWRQAMALAEKSNSLSIRHPELRRANAELIERAGKQAE